MAIEIRPDEMLSASQHGRARCVQNCKMCLSIPLSELFNNVLFKTVQHFSFQQEVKGSRHADYPSITIPWKRGNPAPCSQWGTSYHKSRMTAHIKSSIQMWRCKKHPGMGINNKQVKVRRIESENFHADFRQFSLQLETQDCVFLFFCKMFYSW